MCIKQVSHWFNMPRMNTMRNVCVFVAYFVLYMDLPSTVKYNSTAEGHYALFNAAFPICTVDNSTCKTRWSTYFLCLVCHFFSSQVCLSFDFPKIGFGQIPEVNDERMEIDTLHGHRSRMVYLLTSSMNITRTHTFLLLFRKHIQNKNRCLLWWNCLIDE